jgi:hypothetical protein
METVKGVCGVPEVGGGTTGVLVGFAVVGVAVGRCVGRCVGVRDGEAVAEAETLGEGVALVSCEGDELSISIGIRMSAPTTKNTAAMATLESCIGVLRWWGAHLGDRVGDLGPYSADYPGAKGT